MTAMDIIVLLLMGGNAIFGFRRGFVQEALSMIGLALAITAVRLLHAPATDMLAGITGTDGGAAVLALALIFGITWFVGRMIAQRIGAGSRRSILGPVDRVLGLGFGALKGLLVATVAFVAFAIAYDTIYGAEARRPGWMRHSRTFPLLNASGHAMSQWLAERRKTGGLMAVVGDDEGARKAASEKGADEE